MRIQNVKIVVQSREGYKRQTDNIPARSQLYGLAPLFVGTLEVESLTSYVNRLAWAHGVSPRKFLVEMFVLNLTGGHDLQASARRSGSFGRVRAMRSNGAGEMAWSWSRALERLTARSDLRYLTLHPWANGLPQTRLMRKWPAWCSACYQQWQDEHVPCYQPLLWMIQAVTICPRHKRRLEEQCPFCHKRQSAIPTRSRPGFCTQCFLWLGSPPKTEDVHERSLEEENWQQWMASSMKDFFQASLSLHSFPWERLAANLAACFATRQEEQRTLIRSGILHRSWLDGANSPVFLNLLRLGYALNISPLQFIAIDSEILRNNVQINQKLPQPQLRQHQLTYTPLDRASAKKAIEYALQPRKRKPPLARAHLERQLGLPVGTLKRWFPRQAARLTTQYREYCAERSKQKVAQQCHEVRQAVMVLHEQGITPSFQRVAPLLSHPGAFRSPEVRAALFDARRDLGLES